MDEDRGRLRHLPTYYDLGSRVVRDADARTDREKLYWIT